MNTKEEVTFIGGPMDGRRETRELMPYFRVPVFVPQRHRTLMDSSVEYVEYRLSRFAEGGSMNYTYYVYVLEGMERPMKMLLDRYTITQSPRLSSD